MLFSNLHIFKDNNNSIKTLIIQKDYWAMIDTKRKVF